MNHPNRSRRNGPADNPKMEVLVQTIDQYRTRPISGELAFACFTDEDSLLREGTEILVFVLEILEKEVVAE